MADREKRRRWASSPHAFLVAVAVRVVETSSPAADVKDGHPRRTLHTKTKPFQSSAPLSERSGRVVL